MTRTILVEEAESIKRQDVQIAQRISALNHLAHLPTEQLIRMLETRSYPPPLNESGESEFIVQHLFRFRREELNGSLRERLRAFAYRNSQTAEKNASEGAARKLTYYLALLDGDVARLIAIWKGEPPEHGCYGEMFALMECFGILRVQDATVINDLINFIEQPGMFTPRFDAMIILGRIGTASGQRAVEVIRAVVYDSSEYVTAVRERVCERILTPESDWKQCENCDHGRIANQSHGYPTTQSCPVCLGMGFVPL